MVAIACFGYLPRLFPVNVLIQPSYLVPDSVQCSVKTTLFYSLNNGLIIMLSCWYCSD